MPSVDDFWIFWPTRSSNRIKNSLLINVFAQFCKLKKFFCLQQNMFEKTSITDSEIWPFFCPDNPLIGTSVVVKMLSMKQCSRIFFIETKNETRKKPSTKQADTIASDKALFERQILWSAKSVKFQKQFTASRSKESGGNWEREREKENRVPLTCGTCRVLSKVVNDFSSALAPIEVNFLFFFNLRRPAHIFHQQNCVTR